MPSQFTDELVELLKRSGHEQAAAAVERDAGARADTPPEPAEQREPREQLQPQPDPPQQVDNAGQEFLDEIKSKTTWSSTPFY